jgi:glyoxylase-like metal-dependent hydrolase (beta-lactamase superfamily II)
MTIDILTTANARQRVSTARGASRRSFLRSAGVFTGGAVLLRYAPAGLLAQANTLDARRAQMGAVPIETTRLGDRLIMLSGPGGNVVVLHGDVKIVVDGFVQPAWPRLKAVLDGLDRSPIRSLIDTHWHFDHSDNNLNFRKAGAGVIAHQNTRTRLSQAHDLLGMHFDPLPTAALPTQTFASGLTLNANGEQINLTRVAPAHTDTDIFVFFPKANVLHMGDVFFNGMYPFIDASTGGNIDGMIAGVQDAMTIGDAQTKFVPGHGVLGRRGSLESYGHMLTSVRDAVRRLKAAGKSLADVQAAKPSASFDAAWGKGMMPPDDFVALVYNTLR